MLLKCFKRLIKKVLIYVISIDNIIKEDNVFNFNSNGGKNE